jgi:HAE1 family hydrophobic/amphiphilic exporter-1
VSVAKAVVRRPVLWLVVFALLSICGMYFLSNVAIDMFPEVEAPWLIIYSTYPGADPETVEKSLTDVLEGALANTAGITKMESESREQTGIIFLEFAFGADMDAKMNRVRENIDLVRDSLPETATAPVMMLLQANDEPIMRIALRAKAEAGRDQNELRALAKKEMQKQLEQIEGVATVSVEGGQDAIVQAALSQNRLEAYGVTISEISGSLAAQNLKLGAGTIEEGLVEYSVKTSGEYASLADIAAVVVAGTGGADIRVEDIGEVSMGFRDERSAVYVGGEPGVYLSIMKQRGANTVAVAAAVYERLDELKAALPRDISFEITQDSTAQIRAMIAELINSAVLGVALAMLVLLLFFRNIYSTIIIGLSIPVSFLITLLAMNLAHITVNMMTLAGLILGLGMIVDSSIVVLESISKFREQGEKPAAAVIHAGEEVMSSIIASTITTICVFLPIYLFKNGLGVIGLLVEDMLFTIGISVVSSLLVALFLVPVLAGKWMPVHSRVQKPLRSPFLAGLDRGIARILEAVNGAYRALLSRALAHRLLTLVMTGAAFLGSVLALTKLTIELMPDMDSDIITLSIEMPLGTRYADTKALALEMQEFAIAEIKGAKTIMADVGGEGVVFAGKGNNTAEITVIRNLDDPRADSAGAVKEKLRAHFSAFPNAVFSFPESGLAAIMGDADIDIVLRADDMHKGLAGAWSVKQVLENQIPEVQDIAIDINAGLPQVSVTIDRQRAYNMGLTIAAIANEIAARMNGVTATSFRKSADDYDVVVRLAKEDRGALPDLGKIFVRASNGVLHPVSNFATFEKTLAPASIKHEGQARVIHVTAEVKEGHTIADTEAKIKKLLDEQGIDASFSGASKETRKMLQTFALVITLALLLVFGTMAAQYESFRDPFINFCTIPLALIGVVLVHILTGQAMNAFTMLGFVMLVGIVVNNGIILVDYTNILTRRGMSVMDACLKAGVVRLRPVLMTALTTMLGLAPMAFFPGKSSGMTAPVGLAVFGGLASATFITLFFTPVMYSLVNAKHKEIKDEI